MASLQKLILASGSPRRLELLGQVGIEPHRVMPMEIDETPKRAEHPRSLARRLADDKAAAARLVVADDPRWRDHYILAADTVVAVGRRILPKAERLEEAAQALHLLSGRAHRVYGGLCLVTPAGKVRRKTVETRLRFKRLSRMETDSYLASGEWRGKAGGYAIQGLAGSFVVKLVGSHSNVVGLSLYETVGLLVGEGYDVHSRWLEQDRSGEMMVGDMMVGDMATGEPEPDKTGPGETGPGGAGPGGTRSGKAAPGDQVRQ